MAQLRLEPRNTDAPKILRIGIIQQGKIVEERLVRKRENVTIGQSSKNTFVVPASNYLPRSFTLFELTQAGYALNFTEAMDGRVSLGDQVVALPQLRQAGRVQKKGELWHLAIIGAGTRAGAASLSRCNAQRLATTTRLPSRLR